MHQHHRQSRSAEGGGRWAKGAISLAFPPNDLCDDYFTTSVLSAYFFITAHSRIQIYRPRFPIAIKYSRRRARRDRRLDRSAGTFSLSNISRQCWSGAKKAVNQISSRLPSERASASVRFINNDRDHQNIPSSGEEEDLHPNVRRRPGLLSTPHRPSLPPSFAFAR